MQHDHLYAMLFDARRRELEQYAKQERLAAEVRRRPRHRPAGRLYQLRKRVLASNARVNVSVEEAA